jgi:hypothetical protein
MAGAEAAVAGAVRCVRERRAGGAAAGSEGGGGQPEAGKPWPGGGGHGWGRRGWLVAAGGVAEDWSRVTPKI